MKFVTLAGVGVMATLFAGCGGGSGGERLNRAGFIAKVDAACAASESRIDEGADSILVDKGRVPTSDQLDRFASKVVVPEVQKQLDALRSNKPPSDDQGDVDAIIDTGHKAVNSVKSEPAILHSQRPFDRYSERAERYGLKACGRIGPKVDKLITGDIK